jgi:2-dehydro-3-deoxygluconokinase
MDRVVCFGEMLLRLEAPAGEVLLQTPRLKVTYAGAEGNVAVSLARFGRPASMVTIVPDSRPGQAALNELRRYGVDVARSRTGPGRMGLFFLTPGAVLRPSEVIYDRADSAFALAAPDDIDWDKSLEGAGWLHVSGITPSLGPNAAAAAIRAVEAATRLGVRVSFDGNFRPKLWALWEADPAPILLRLIAHATVAFIEERDISRVLGRAFTDEDPHVRDSQSAAAAFEAFPRLEVLTHTFRKQYAVDDHELTAVLRTRGGAEHRAGPYRLSGVVDRVGGGDAFAAGVLHRLADGGDPGAALRFGLAATALKHGIYGDFNLTTEADVQVLADGAGGLDVRR